MTSAPLRKLRQLASDQTLRSWLLARLIGREAAPPAFKAHCPPYVTSLELGEPPKPIPSFAALSPTPPANPLRLDLAGLTLDLHPGQEAELFDRNFDDVEQLLALHRFAWIEEATDPAWVAAIWNVWRQRFQTPDSGWPWHPYTAAERAINLLSFAKRHGLAQPYADSWNALAAHAPAIAAKLEYFGPHYTGNHLANDGRGLYCLGIHLGWERAASLGGKILLEEAKRIFSASGLLIEGSAHYHFLLTKNYEQAAQWAKEAQRPEAASLAEIAARARHAAGGLLLAGGLPLIGDISPDLSPQRLAPLFNRTEADLSADGWHRLEQGDWSMLLYASPDGWPPMPGHGHQDLGGFELHWKGVPLIVDPGRGRYGEDGEAALYRSAAVHNGVILSGQDPRPANRPYYSDAFRRRTGGAPPKATASSNAMTLQYGIGRANVARVFAADLGRFSIQDNIDGYGRFEIERGLVIPLPVDIQGCQASIRTPAGDVRLIADAPLSASQITRWTRYGQGQPATRINIKQEARLPWQGRLSLEAA
ncbi:Heparinase II III family protein [Rhodospirillaceae bacterium LM-1]|nr:Heparinase II III family protein [Rhodospirillaceae bacterium LM-1]